jgi:hypothetical protein
MLPTVMWVLIAINGCSCLLHAWMLRRHGQWMLAKGRKQGRQQVEAELRIIAVQVLDREFFSRFPLPPSATSREKVN